MKSKFKDMPKTYSPKEFESALYEKWMDSGCFTAKVDKKKEPFCIVMPPPNITGQLHMGHALDDTIQDTITRFKRMQGYSALWLPGKDHASIATEVKIVEEMKKEGLTKNYVGREGFLERAWAWTRKYGNRISEQIKRLGCSCDWSREAFTMDEHCSRAVAHVFVDLYNKGLIYKGDRIINWCPSCKTALSDAEVEYEEQASHLWHIRYPFEDGSGYITVATTRPETILGDTAVAVNPKDERYADAVGKNLVLPLVGRLIPVVADDDVEKDFGSGAVKITPAHDPNDFEVGLRHNLPVIRVMNDDGSLNEQAGEKYCGLTREKAREVIVDDLREGGYLVKIEDYTHNVGQCYRCHSTVEPIVSKQWFVKMQPLAKPAIEAVKKKKTEFIPDRFSKIYFNWMENVKDWCISRQLWWGHRIPAYYCEKCGHMTVAESKPDKCPECGHTVLNQDEDVLDTWFSSALWPFSTLGFPDKTADLDYFYPNSLLVTAYDIIFFWVARMIFSGIEHMGEVPFSEVLIHGIVRDKLGRKMSKSLGNGIDPLEVIDKYGADSLRFSLVQGVAPGSDMRYMDEKTESARNFMNKIWNASRFVLMNCEGVKLKEMGTFRLTHADKWILCRLNGVIKDVTKNLEKYELGLAAGKLYDFVWAQFCDWYIELSKPALYETTGDAKVNTLSVLTYVLETVLKLLHPFVPFVTEEIYGYMPGVRGKLMMQKWPQPVKKFSSYRAQEADFDKVIDLIKSIRNIKNEMNVAPSKKVELFIAGGAIKPSDFTYVKKLAGVSEIKVVAGKEEIGVKTVSVISAAGEAFMPLGELVDTEKEKARLADEIEHLEKEIGRSKGLLANQGFIAKAPKQLVEKEKAKLDGNCEKLEKLRAQLKLMEE